VLSKKPFVPSFLGALLAGLSLVGCASFFGLDEYEITEDTRCGEELVDLSSNPDHCGECDTACGSHEECLNGNCVCEQGTEACSGACVDLDSNADHCGNCDTACPSEASCRSGSCRCDDSDLDLCSGECVDTTRDSDHCGACDEACAVGASCDNGTCACDDDDFEVCAGRCVDLTTDEANCGGCGDACPSGATCTASRCVCPSGRTVCSGACVDVATDEEHCGGCGNDCNVSHATSVCQNGTCAGEECSDGYGDCNGDLFMGEAGDGCEVATDSDEMHCGACNVACDPTDTCTGGSCDCDVVTSDGGECSPSGCGCGPSEGCYYNTTDLLWECYVAGPFTEGSACEYNNDCAAGHSCVDNVCRTYCGQGQTCDGGCSPVYLDAEPVDDWNYCHAICDPVPTSDLSQQPDCAPGEHCAVLFSGSTACLPGSPNPVGQGARCASTADCQTGFYCNDSLHCQSSCWMEDDTCPSIASGHECRGYSNGGILIDGNEIGTCLPPAANSGCKEVCTTTADCVVIGTECTDTTSGRICLNEQCQECFDVSLVCSSDSDTCAFLQCTP